MHVIRRLIVRIHCACTSHVPSVNSQLERGMLLIANDNLELAIRILREFDSLRIRFAERSHNEEGNM